MSRKDAHAFAASLAATLMVSIVVFQAGDGTFGAVPADEIDGDEVQVVSEFDPWAWAHGFGEGPGTARQRRPGPFACQPFWPPGRTRRRWSAPPHKDKKEFSRVHDMFPLRLPNQLCP